ncbi:ABC transporter permease [Candidatus Magnetominusculus dajiuhuensis]|uniref:ABC transporter permease n=1 Tax=Candidatus Magnetominusculus dajiuhuensis TaxID=3137712 RepID=UPI003B434321
MTAAGRFFPKNIYLNLAIAVKSLGSFKLRTFLAIAGVVLGTLSLITVANTSRSMELKTINDLERFGKNLLTVKSGLTRGHGSPTDLTASLKLTPDDARAIKESLPEVKTVAPAATKTFPIKYKNTTVTGTMMMGIPMEFFKLKKIPVGQGRLFTEKDAMAKVAIIGSKAAGKLFKGEAPIGKTIFVNQAALEVIEVLEPMAVDLSEINEDNIVYVPLSTFMKRLTNTPTINLIYVEAASEVAAGQLKGEIEALLRQRHNIKKGERDDFTVTDLKDINSMQTKTMKIVVTLGMITSAISFTISSIGILSVMILMVDERKVEIGIRRVVGARKRDIALQFLTEASFISLIGAAAGLIAGIALTLAISSIAKIPFAVSPAGVVVSFVASIVTGIASGIYPSIKAMAIQPVNILRS